MNEEVFWKIKRDIDNKVKNRLSRLSFLDRLTYGSFEAYNDILKEFKQQEPETYEAFIRFAKENEINIYEFDRPAKLLYIVGVLGLIGLAFIIPIIGIPLLIIFLLAALGDKLHRTRSQNLRKIRKKLSEDK